MQSSQGPPHPSSTNQGSTSEAIPLPGLRPQRPPADTSLWGLPIGNFGLFASALIAAALGLGGFCLSCFVSILGILLWNSTGHPPINYADSYLYIALPVGIATLCVSSAVLLALWIRRQFRNQPARS
jgi:hypothetical protein